MFAVLVRVFDDLQFSVKEAAYGETPYDRAMGRLGRNETLVRLLVPAKRREELLDIIFAHYERAEWPSSPTWAAEDRVRWTRLGRNWRERKWLAAYMAETFVFMDRRCLPAA